MKIFQNRLFRLIVTIVCLVAVVSLSRSIYGLWRRRDIVKERSEVLAKTEAENKKLKDELIQAESPGFVEKEARNRLGMIKEGEQVVIIGKSTVNSQRPFDNAQGRQVSEKTQSQNLPNWKQWWRIFF